MRFGFLVAVYGIVLVLAAPASAAINSGDKLNVHVYNHPELSSVVTVDSTGAIQLPVVGAVRVQGLDSKDVAYAIVRRIKPYVPFPSVDVQDTSESQMLFVSGAPGGVFPYSPNETLAAAVAEITKTTPVVQNSLTPSNAAINYFDYSRLDLRRVTVYRSGRPVGTYNVVALRGEANPGPTLHANDTVAFSNKPISVTVLGAVNAPGGAYLWPDEPLSDAISQAGGPSLAAASGRLELSRGHQPGQTIAFGNEIFNQPARSGDVITIPTAPRITVSGLVEKPGTVTLPNDFSLISAIGAAGGYNKYGDLRKVQVVHDGVTTQYNIVGLAHGDLSQNPTLHDGDSVFVPEGHKTDWSMVWQALGSVGGVSSLYYNVRR